MVKRRLQHGYAIWQLIACSQIGRSGFRYFLEVLPDFDQMRLQNLSPSRWTLIMLVKLMIFLMQLVEGRVLLLSECYKVILDLMFSGESNDGGNPDISNDGSADISNGGGHL